MFTVGTWNVENLFRPGGEFGPKAEADYEAKLDALAARVTAMAPDVLAVQEVGDEDAFTDLADRLGGSWYSVLSAHFDKHHPIRVGFLSRHRLQVVADTAVFPEELAPLQADDDPHKLTTAMGRGALAIRLTAPGSGTALTVVTCHLKSKLLTFPPGPGGRRRFAPRDEGERARYAAYALYRRAAEAVTVRALADDLLAGHGDREHLVVMGDLNDEATAATTQILHGPGGSEIGTPGETRPDKGDPWRLWNLAPLIPEAERFSRVYRGRGELIDHILVSRALLQKIDSVRTGNHHDDGLPSVDDDPAARREARDSDHAPVVAQLAI
ncbi:MAG: endonuclease/exonuclease/phosphatase family protein [Micromonosporaceae bacterium]